MKKTLAILAAMLACMQLLAQTKSSYLITKGDKKVTDVEWTEKATADGIILDIVTKGDKHTVMTGDKNGRTTRWQIVTVDGKNDYTVERKGDVYTITGKVAGKQGVKKEIQSEHNPWYQCISFSAGKLLSSENSSMNYECIRPSNGKLATMSISIAGETQICGHKVYDIKASTTGMIDGLWSCHYFVDCKTGQFIMYKGVEGVPGTPMTQWMLQ